MTYPWMPDPNYAEMLQRAAQQAQQNPPPNPYGQFQPYFQIVRPVKHGLAKQLSDRRADRLYALQTRRRR